MESQLQQLDHKNSLIDMKNDHQDREIQLLKTLMSKILNKESNNTNEDILNNERMMQKRPARLLPSYLFKYFKHIRKNYLFDSVVYQQIYLGPKKRNQ